VDTSPSGVAHKLLAVNLSDIASMGAVPKYYLIGASLPIGIGADFYREFSCKLAEMQEEYLISLIGGDTTKHNGKLILSLTMIGIVERGRGMLRSEARIGDGIFVSGKIGGGYIGLRDKNNVEAREKYLRPVPRVKLGREMLEAGVRCCTDVSDGLLLDLGTILSSSGVGAEIDLSLVPMFSGDYSRCDLASGGDDYELLFTSKTEMKNRDIVKIGEITGGRELKIFDNKVIITPEKLGFSH